MSVCRYGDMRVMMTYELFSMWQNLGKIFFSDISCSTLQAGRWCCCSYTLVCKSLIQFIYRINQK